MATTTGRVTRMIWQSQFVCLFVETAPSNQSLFVLQFHAGDSAFVTEHKRQLAKLLAVALTSRRRVGVQHETGQAVVRGIDFLLPDISPVGPAVQGDFYSITGNGIPNTAQVVFETGVSTVTVTPDLRRPHWVLIERLPAAVPAGPCTVRLTAPGWQSDRVPITVFTGAAEARRTLYPGRPSASPPYTFVFAATPGLEAESGGGVATDPVRNDRATYHDVVRHCLANLLTVTESLLRDGGLERQVRFVSIFDPAAAVNAASALVKRVSPNLIEPMRARMNGFVGRYWEDPDIVFAVSGSTTHTRASAWFTTDDGSRPGVTFTYDGVSRTHRRFTDIPGSAAISTQMDQSGLTAIHEFGHAASDFGNGMVIDLYVDGTRTGFVVNKKMRAQASDTIPANFATYAGTTFTSDTARDGLGYPNTWRSFHPALVDAARPNLMDNYWLASSNVQACRLDGLTFQWFRDRLRAKILR
jgi:hypothetical protein